MNPCEHDIVGRLRQRLGREPISADELLVHFEPADEEDAAAANTAMDLLHVHASRKENGRLLRARIHARWLRVQGCLNRLWRRPDEQTHRSEPKMLVARDSPFAGLMRSYVLSLDRGLFAELFPDAPELSAR